MVKWKRNVWKETDLEYVYYTYKTDDAYCEIRLYGNTREGDCDLLCERRISEDTWQRPGEWETVIDREMFPSFKEAKRKAEGWMNNAQLLSC